MCAWYVRRGEPELWIKDLKDAGFADRLSCHRCWANQFRLLLHTAAYWLLDTLRRALVHVGTPRMQLDTLRLRLVKIGGWLRQVRHRRPLRRSFQLHLASSHPGEPLWQILSAHFNPRE
jgi:Transposase DDE domain group 1